MISASTMTVPVMMSSRKLEMPIKVRPLLSVPMTSAPMIVPMIVPRPPDSEVPPSTTAAMA